MRRSYGQAAGISTKGWEKVETDRRTVGVREISATG